MSSSVNVDIPTGWVPTRLNELAAINPEQLGEATDPRHLIDYIDLSCVSGPSAVPETATMRYEDAPSRARRVVQDNDLLVTTVRPYLRGFTRVPAHNPENGQLIASTGFAVVRPKQANDTAFLYQHVLSDRFLAWLLPLMTGSNYPAVNASDVGDYPFSCPPESERHCIGRVLCSVDDAIDATRRVIEQTRQLKTAVLQDLLTHGLPGQHSEFREAKGIGMVPAAWKQEHISTLCSDIVDCPHTTPRYLDDGVPVIRTTAVRDGMLIKDELNYTSEAEYTERISRLIPQPEDIVFTREAPVCEAFVIPKGMRLSLGQRTMLLRTNPEKLDPHFFTSLLYERRFRRRIIILAGGSTNPHLNVSEVRDLSIATPPIDEQNAITKCLRAQSDREAVEQQTLKQLEQLKIALSQALLTGRVRVPAMETRHA